MLPAVMSRRKVLRSGLAGVVGIALSACAATPAPGGGEEQPQEVAEQATTAEQSAPSGTTGAVTIVYGGGSASTHQVSGFQEILNRFAEVHPEIVVDYQYKPDYWQALEVQLAGGLAPDTSWMGPGNIYHYFQTDMLVDTTDFIERDGVDLTNYAGEGREALFAGRYYGMPFNSGITIFYYNRTMFDEVGLEYPTSDWTWNDVREAGIALTQDKTNDGNNDQWGLFHRNSEEFGWGPLILSNGGHLFSGAVLTDAGGYYDGSKSPHTCVATSEASLQALTWVQENICELGIYPRPGTISLAPGVANEFNSGLIGMQIEGSWRVRPAIEGTQFEFDVEVLPKSPFTNERRTNSNAMPNAIFKFGKHHEESWQLLKWLAEEESQGILAKSLVKEPVLISAFDAIDGPPSNLKRVLSESLTNHNFLNGTVYAFEGATEALARIRSTLELAWTCERPIAEVVAEAEAAANAAIAEA